MVWRRDGVCISIRINDGIIWVRAKKYVIYRLDIIFSVTHVSKINFFCQRDIRRYPDRDIGRKIVACQEVEKWEGLIVSMWHFKKLQFMFTETRQISNLWNQDVSKEIPSDLVRKDVAEFSDKFSHFQYATLEMFKVALNDYSMLKLRFFNKHRHFCNVL